MGNPIKNQGIPFSEPRKKKKSVKEIDQRVRKAAKKSEPSILPKTGKAFRATQDSQKAYLSAEKAASAARLIASETQRAALIAQKKAFKRQEKYFL